MPMLRTVILTSTALSRGFTAEIRHRTQGISAHNLSRSSGVRYRPPSLISRREFHATQWVEDRSPDFVSRVKSVFTGKSQEDLKFYIKKYGKVALATHLSLSVVSITTCYSLVRTGIDVKPITDFFGLDGSSLPATEFALAYGIHKAITPLRVPITVAALPIVIRYTHPNEPAHKLDDSAQNPKEGKE